MKTKKDVETMPSGAKKCIPTHQIYTVYDVVADEYSPPFVSKSDATASRQFLMMFDDNRMNMSDYQLIFIAFWDNDRAVIDPCIPKEVILTKEKPSMYENEMEMKNDN